MDTDIDMEVVAESRPVAAFVSLELLFEQQEQRFSRFRADSLLSRLNRGEAIEDGFVATAVALALRAHVMTGGAFNPMVLRALEAAGYDRSFGGVAGLVTDARHDPGPAPSLADCLRLNGDRVELVAGRIDLGGIVKGWTVDLAVALLEQGFPAGLVNAGGDLRCFGEEEPGAGGWAVEVKDHVAGGTAWKGNLKGALATSTTLKRRWQNAAGDAHHVIDPRTGASSASGIAQASCWASETWTAEVWAKAILIDGEPAIVAAEAAGVRSLVVWADQSAASRAP